ncbi:RDD family protein [Galactobacter valiniphilus]|uniref:RDD family protein n=1 Tax=Galactobacter valiniphilus TaxID=2676122 RepID=A0A399JBN6_9MICC|nr:RDD family protein [Galactobacter valiniphilus]RII42983.1 RDD family protein [Galactobacter valiniphilus]
MTEKDPERITRADLGSWISGPPQLNTQAYPGQRMGRPQAGPGSIARWGRRIVAILIDWALAYVISLVFWGGNEWVTLSLFAAMTLLGVCLFGHSIGHRLLGMQVQKLNGTAARPLDGLIRTLLVLLVVPPFIQDADTRGLHDRARGTILVRIR